VHRHVPDSYEQLFLEYWDFTVNFVRKEGIHESWCDDVAAEILLRLEERDYLSLFDPETVTTRGTGKPRFVQFKSFLSASLKLYARGHREKQALSDHREPLWCDTQLESGEAWLSVYGPAEADHADHVEKKMITEEWFARARAQMRSLGLEEFFDVVHEVAEETGKVTVAALMRETGLARPVVSSMLEAVRESLQDAA
jgi:hypothetical protein